MRIASAQQVGVSSAPVFILSPYRSGTTLVRFILDSHSHLACPPETDFVPLLAGVLEDPESLSGLNSMGFDAAHVTVKVREMCDYFFGNYAASAGKSRWVDKSPSYVMHIGLLRKLFPDARYVILHRHPLDQIESFTRGGTITHRAIEPYLRAGEDIRVAAARYWSAATRQLIEASDDNSIVCHYMKLCQDPVTEVKRITDFLGEPWEPDILKFNSFSHDLGKESVRIRGTRGFEPVADTYVSWDADLIAQCWAIVAEEARSLGYSVVRS